jgi:SAM-dependent methyltransferase
VSRLRQRVGSSANGLIVPAARGLASLSRTLLMRPFRNEEVEIPTADGTAIDVVEDLVEYTRLPRQTVVELLERRHENFRTEWHLLPAALRQDDWYYVSAHCYLFANAVHEEPETRLLPELHASRGPLRILDYGGGTGNFALEMANRGHQVDYVELSALQKDFVRFRAAKHGLDGRLSVLDAWAPLPRGVYDAVCAFDLLEHLPRLEQTLEQQLLPALRLDGSLVERSAFERDLANPMHHDDERPLRTALARWGFEQVTAVGALRVWRRH